MEALVLNNVNELPSPTWNHLAINSIQLNVPAVEGFDAAAQKAEGPTMGAGPQATAWLDAAAGGVRTVQVPAGAVAAEPVVVDLAADENPVQSLDVTVGEGAQVQLVLVGRRGEAAPAGAAPATCGWNVRIRAAADARVDVYAVAAAAGWQLVDNIGVEQAAGAQVNVRQFYLDAALTSVGFASDLAGDRGALSVDARYLGRGEQVLDFGYSVRQLACKTTCDMDFRGVLADSCTKSLRDTIDLVRGCKGSQGRENETVVLAGDNVGNKSLPVILCSEDDVAGDHGATMGEIGAAELAYLAARGLAPEDVPALVMESTFEAALAAAPVAAAREAVAASARAVLGADVADEMAAE